MRTTTLLPLMCPLLLIAACSGGEEAGNNGTEEATTVSEPVAENLMVDPQNSVVPIATPSATETATRFPATFLGRWGLVAADCEPGRDDAKGLMTVTADRLAFYESRATPTRIAIAAPERLVADLSYSGEGQNWTTRETLTLTDAGRTLVREGSETAPSLRYARCPA